jgi:hypothetical protein
MTGESAVDAVLGAGLDVRIAFELLERADAEGGCRCLGRVGCCSRCPGRCRRAVLEAEMVDHLG